MSRTSTSKARRRQHRGVIQQGFVDCVTWAHRNLPELQPYQMSAIAALETKGHVTFHMSSRFARRYDRTVNMLAEYQAEHDGQMPPSLHEILGGPEPVDIHADIETGMEQMRQDRMKATTRPIGAEERWNESQKDNPYPHRGTRPSLASRGSTSLRTTPAIAYQSGRRRRGRTHYEPVKNPEAS